MENQSEKVADLGGGRKLIVDAESLKLESGPQSESVPLASIRRAALVQRRVWFFAFGAVLGALFAGFVSSSFAKAAVAVLAAWNVWMWIRMREFAIHVERKDGVSTILPLGQGGAEKKKATEAGWEIVSGELSRQGIELQR
ncbi:MAG: hypothetical protein WBV82_32500 [Myxococcaceae bacterium]